MGRPAGIDTQHVLDTALELFEAQGFNATSLRQIADRLGTTKAALYYHFPAKEQLVVELTRPFLDALSNMLSISQDDRGGEGDRARLLEDYLDVFLTHHRVVRFISFDVGAQQHPDVGARARTLVMALRDTLAGPDAGEHERIRVACALGVINAVAGLSPQQAQSARATVLECARLVLDTVRTGTAAED